MNTYLCVENKMMKKYKPNINEFILVHYRRWVFFQTYPESQYLKLLSARGKSGL